MAGEIFISYRRADEAWARLLHARLQAEGVEAWYDAQVGAGQDWRVATAKALEASRIFVLLFSASAAQSDDIAKELAAATLEKKLIIPVRLENIAPKGAFLYELASRNWINAFEDTEEKLAQLAHSLAKLVKDGIEDESILPFDRAASGKAKRPRRASYFAAALVALMAVAGAAALWLLPHKAPSSPANPDRPVAVRIAVLPFETLGDDAALRQFAGGLEGEIVGRLSQNQVPVVSGQDSADLKGQAVGAAAAKLHVAYVFTGTIERSGKDILVRAHLDDARQNVTVWSSEFTGDGGDPRPLQEAISTQASLVGSAAIRNDKLANGDTDAMGLLIKSVQYSLSNRPEDREAEWDTSKKLAAKFSDRAYFHADFAIVSAFLAIDSPPERAAELRASAKTEAQRALALDPHDSLAFLAQSLLIPSVGHWAEREQFLLRGLSVAPQDGALTNHESNFLRGVGRLKDAVAYGRQAQAVLPLTANRNATLVLALAVTGNSFEAGPLAETTLKSWPLHPAVWNARFETAIFASRWDDALTMLTPGGYVPIPEPVADAWRSALKAEKSGNPGLKRDAVRQIIAQLDPAAIWAAPPPNEVMTPGGAIGMLAILGDKDAAFAQAKAYLKQGSYADSAFLFWPNLGEFRRDPRFMLLAAAIGLVDYWRSSGNWPDFCADPALPYNCRTEAAGRDPAR